MSRLENTPSKIEIARMMAATVDLFCASWARLPAAIPLDIDDTLDRVQASKHDANHGEANEGGDGAGGALEVARQSAVSADPGYSSAEGRLDGID